MPEGKILKGYLVPGLPHLIFSREDDSRAALRLACRSAGVNVYESQPDVLVIFSTQWVSVLGHLVQGRRNPNGLHVDENWYDLGDLPYDFHTDVELAESAIEQAQAQGLQVRSVDYEGFPVDTGTLVALNFFNPKNEIPTLCVSCNIYAGREEEIKFGRAVGAAVCALGRHAVAIASTGLSGHYFTHDLTDAEERIVSKQDDAENRKLLDLVAASRWADAMDFIPEYARKTNADMMFKAFYWLMGVLGSSDFRGKVIGYGSIWGSGAAVIEFAR